jgi:hypothetical protein
MFAWVGIAFDNQEGQNGEKAKSSQKGHRSREQLARRSKAKLPKDHLEQFWFCDSCSCGPQLAFTEHCPTCQHRRCADCKTELHKIRNAEGYSSCIDACSGSTVEGETSFTTPKPALPNLLSSSPTPTTPSRPFQ